MKVNNLTLSAVGLLGLVAAQNGNDPLILNNRTGLSPVVYDTLSISYTKLQISETTRERFLQALPVTISIMPSTAPSNSHHTEVTTSAECWHNGYPCSQNGGQDEGQDIQNHVANAVRATTTSTIDELSTDPSEAIFSILPVPAPTLAAEVDSVEARVAGVPVDWWRGPGQPVDPEGPSGRIQHHPAVHSVHSVNCNMHYCPTQKSSIARLTFSHTSLSTMQTSVATGALPTATGTLHSAPLPALPALIA